MPTIPQLKELGHTGLKQYAGVIYEEQLRQLQSPTMRRRIYQEMTENDAIIGAVLFAITMLFRQSEWKTKAASDVRVDLEAAEFLASCMDDMSQSWADTISEIVSFVWWGFSVGEIVYKYRNGDSRDPSKRSRYVDGKIGWRKIAGRAQDTISGWDFDDSGGIRAIKQQAPPNYVEVTIPIVKALLFRTTTYKGNPEGSSVLRNSYRSWYFLKRFQEIEAIGVERDLAGFPVIYVPPEWTETGANGDLQSAFTDAKDLVTNIKRDEQEGAVLPAIYDENNNQILRLELLTSDGKRSFNVDKIISRYEQNIARTVLADFLFLGAKSVGSFALSSDKTELFATAIGAWLDVIAGIFNRHAIPRLFALNGWELENLPMLIPGDIETPSLPELADFVSKLSGAGIDFTDLDTQNYLRESANFPLMTEEDYEEKERKKEQNKPEPVVEDEETDEGE